MGRARSAWRACDALPLWVADMDFEIMPQVNEAIRRRTEHAVYGYPSAVGGALCQHPGLDGAAV